MPVTVTAGAHGPWRVTDIRPCLGATLPPAARLRVEDGDATPDDGAWRLRGVTSNLRYTAEAERATLAGVQQGLGRPQASRAALIPIRKSAAWWDMAQDARRAVLEEESRHIAIGLEYLPGVARRLIHSRDLGEPFDFLTWFEFAPEHEAGFDTLLSRLRATKEWGFVEREVEIRLARD
ncbi:chlorite dismutase family protein [Roseomonas fluvialis]|uniref:chlorite dismutase family protein n=1 Tax=Roseomonas fluvialis TaxID=1750527 RepID=UPI001FCD554B|nr:chlorite dismutase family protein [Roseomonas fluvialis]